MKGKLPTHRHGGTVDSLKKGKIQPLSFFFQLKFRFSFIENEVTVKLNSSVVCLENTSFELANEMTSLSSVMMMCSWRMIRRLSPL